MRENINAYDVTKRIVRFDDYIRRQLMVSKESRYNLGQGWAIISADGPHVGRPSPSRAELLDEQKRAQ